jgi:hypothetical protein
MGSITKIKNLMNAEMESGMVPEVKGGRSAKEKGSMSGKVSIHKRGSLVVSKAVVDDLGFKEGNASEAKKSKVGITRDSSGCSQRIPGKIKQRR